MQSACHEGPTYGTSRRDVVTLRCPSHADNIGLHGRPVRVCKNIHLDRTAPALCGRRFLSRHLGSPVMNRPHPTSSWARRIVWMFLQRHQPSGLYFPELRGAQTFPQPLWHLTRVRHRNCAFIVEAVTVERDRATQSYVFCSEYFDF